MDVYFKVAQTPKEKKEVIDYYTEVWKEMDKIKYSSDLAEEKEYTRKIKMIHSSFEKEHSKDETSQENSKFCNTTDNKISPEETSTDNTNTCEYYYFNPYNIMNIEDIGRKLNILNYFGYDTFS